MAPTFGELLGVNQSTASITVYGEFARLPMYVMRQIRIIKNWYQVTKQP